MKHKLWQVLVLVMFTTLAVRAQDSARVKKNRWDAAAKADKFSDRLNKELDLSKEQSQKIAAINEDIERRRDHSKKDASLSSRQRMQVYQQLDAERSNRYKAVLTPAQYKKWNDWELKKKTHMEDKMDRKQDKQLARKASV